MDDAEIALLHVPCVLQFIKELCGATPRGTVPFRRIAERVAAGPQLSDAVLDIVMEDLYDASVIEFQKWKKDRLVRIRVP